MTRVVSEGAGNGLLVKLPVGAERADDFAAFEDAHDAYVIFSNELALNVVRAPVPAFLRMHRRQGEYSPRTQMLLSSSLALGSVDIHARARRELDHMNHGQCSLTSLLS